jgi:hypothetical protein
MALDARRTKSKLLCFMAFPFGDPHQQRPNFIDASIVFDSERCIDKEGAPRVSLDCFKATVAAEILTKGATNLETNHETSSCMLAQEHRS